MRGEALKGSQTCLERVEICKILQKLFLKIRKYSWENSSRMKWSFWEGDLSRNELKREESCKIWI